MSKTKVEKEVESWEAEAKAGMESVRQQDMGLPFAIIIEANSPQAMASSAQYDENIKQGDIVLSTTSEILASLKKEMVVVPCYMKTMWVQYIQRSKGGGFVAANLSDDIMRECELQEIDGKKKWIHRTLQHEIVETAYWFCLLDREDGSDVEKIILTMSSSRLKDSRTWLGLISGIRLNGKNGKFCPPMYSHAYKIKSGPRSKAQYSWFGFDIEVYKPLAPSCKEVAGARDHYATTHSDITTGTLQLGAPVGEEDGVIVPEVVQENM